MNRNYQTQWAGQFGVAHELSRRGYLVTFTTGNAPAVDLLCQSPSGIAFSVQIKSISSKTSFLFQKSLLKSAKNRFFVFVLIPELVSKPPEYFVLNNEQFLDLHEEQRQILEESDKKKGKTNRANLLGVNYRVLAKKDFRDAWAKNLPA